MAALLNLRAILTDARAYIEHALSPLPFLHHYQAGAQCVSSPEPTLASNTHIFMSVCLSVQDVQIEVLTSTESTHNACHARTPNVHPPRNSEAISRDVNIGCPQRD
ncbi:uncharacterized protein BJ212DRAFT_407502 [Suillus subaureus]|uniref:Uncharacterized protein n=1 Tax=Suillus subaureus TaxID=48587 RepID=A0A9P7DKN0_9AGAM|nr:uncharacterized protein BJ212DRAFT_407502 [Suillus subaureus]KAG1797155.1 hypothetical protein BJ212DRAFT_407502 [Suillus subaureus]